MDRTTSLTAHLARAAGAIAVEPVVDEPADIATPAEPGEDVEGRCAASVISGQRCRRPAAEGHTLCPGHIAMGTKAPELPRPRVR